MRYDRGKPPPLYSRELLAVETMDIVHRPLPGQIHLNGWRGAGSGEPCVRPDFQCRKIRVNTRFAPTASESDSQTWQVFGTWAARGSLTRNVVPTPGWVWTSISPPIALTSSFDTESPNPRP